MRPSTVTAAPFFLHFSSAPGAAPATDQRPELKSRPERESTITLQKIESGAADPTPEPLLEARPDSLMGSLGVGALLGMIVARLILADPTSMLLGGIAGMAASGIVYAGGVCLLACHQRESREDSFWLRGDKVPHLRENLEDASSDIEAAMQETADDDLLVDTTSNSHDSSRDASN